MTSNVMNKTKFEQLFESSHAKVRRFALGLCRNSSDADDLVQEAYVRAFRHFDEERDTSTFENWLFKITKNLYLDLRRSRNRRPEPLSLTNDEMPSDYSDYLVDPTPNAEDMMISNEADPAMTHALTSLSEHDRQLLIMTHIEDLSYRQIAVRLDIPLTSVRSRIHRARKRLRSAYFRQQGSKSDQNNYHNMRPLMA